MSVTFDVDPSFDFFIVLFCASCYTHKKYIFMFFEPPYLWRMLWCVGLIAESRRSRGKVWKRPSLPAGFCLHCKGKPAWGLRSFCAL